MRMAHGRSKLAAWILDSLEGFAQLRAPYTPPGPSSMVKEVIIPKSLSVEGIRLSLCPTHFSVSNWKGLGWQGSNATARVEILVLTRAGYITLGKFFNFSPRFPHL